MDWEAIWNEVVHVGIDLAPQFLMSPFGPFVIMGAFIVALISPVGDTALEKVLYFVPNVALGSYLGAVGVLLLVRNSVLAKLFILS